MQKKSLFTKFFQAITSSFLPIASFIFVAGALLVTPAINTHAQSISLEPISIDRSNPNERGWFLYNVKPGQVVEDTLVVRNASAFDTKVSLNANDATVTTDGTFSLLPNDAENKNLGSWISLSQSTLPIKSGENIGIPFKITVPSNIKSGEYAGGLSAIIVNDNEQGGGIGAKLRLGVRMYLTVSGDLNLNPAISKMEIANPQQSDFEDRLRARGSVTPGNMGFYLTAQEKGNIYSKSVNKATFTLPDGKTETRDFTRNYIPGQPETEFYLQTDIPYQVGTTSVKLDYEASPFISNKPDLKSSNTKGIINYTLNLSQADYDKLVSTYNTIKKEGDDRRGKPIIKSTPAQSQALTVGENNTVDVTPVAASNSTQMIVYVLIGVILLLIIVLVAVIVRNKMAKNKAAKIAAKSTPAATTPTPAQTSAPVAKDTTQKKTKK